MVHEYAYFVMNIFGKRSINIKNLLVGLTISLAFVVEKLVSFYTITLNTTQK